jgi:hypothetical protein
VNCNFPGGVPPPKKAPTTHHFSYSFPTYLVDSWGLFWGCQTNRKIPSSEDCLPSSQPACQGFCHIDLSTCDLSRLLNDQSHGFPASDD